MSVSYRDSTRPRWRQTTPAACVFAPEVEQRLREHALHALRTGHPPQTWRVTASDDHGHEVQILCNLEDLWTFAFRV